MIYLKLQAIDAFESAIDYMDRVYKELPSMIEEYKSKNIVEASDKMMDLSDGLNWIYDVIRLTSDFNTLNSSDMMEFYAEMTDALENKEYDLLADMLQYELMPIIKNWRESLIDSLNKMTSN